MRNYSEDELKEQSAEYFKSNPKAKTFYATTDGNFFAEADLQHANYHANAHGLEVVTIDKPTSTKAIVKQVIKEFKEKKKQQQETKIVKLPTTPEATGTPNQEPDKTPATPEATGTPNQEPDKTPATPEVTGANVQVNSTDTQAN